MPSSEIRTARDYDAVRENGGVVMFHKIGCGPCKSTKPHFDALADAHGRELGFYNVESKDLPAVGERILSFPTIIKWHDGRPTRIIGSKDKQTLKEWLNLSDSRATPTPARRQTTRAPEQKRLGRGGAKRQFLRSR